VDACKLRAGAAQRSRLSIISRWHVVDADEIWNFYEGAPLELLAYDPKRRALVRSVLGATKNDRERAAVVRKGVWQAARSMGDFSLMGCSVAPGFEFDGFRFVTQVRSFRAHFKGALAPLASLL
jgi:predicted cupin superfamily sugar epimerase